MKSGVVRRGCAPRPARYIRAGRRRRRAAAAAPPPPPLLALPVPERAAAAAACRRAGRQAARRRRRHACAPAGSRGGVLPRPRPGPAGAAGKGTYLGTARPPGLQPLSGRGGREGEGERGNFSEPELGSRGRRAERVAVILPLFRETRGSRSDCGRWLLKKPKPSVVRKALLPSSSSESGVNCRC